MLGATCLGIAGVIHLLPFSGVSSAKQLEVLYEVKIEDENVQVLMRNRAVLFGVLGVNMLYGAVEESARIPAVLSGLASVCSFLWLAKSTRNKVNPALARVVKADYIALLCLVVAATVQ